MPEEQGNSSRRGQSSGKTVSFNASRCRWPVVIEAAQARGWQVVSGEENRDTNDIQCNVHWFDDGHIGDSLKKLQPWMKVNRFPGMHHLLGRKCQLARTMTRLKKLCPIEYDHVPRTWILPQDYNELISRFAREGDRTVYIVKPDGSSQGRGIFLTDDIERIRQCAGEAFAVQKYILNPMLLDGYKFDLRVYFLVSAAPTEAGLELRCFMFRDGLVRLCTQEYKLPTRETFEQLCTHLTNYSVNKFNEDFKANTDKADKGTGSKRSLAWLMDYIESEFGKVERDRVWMEMMGICVKTLLSVQLTLEVEYDTVFPRDYTRGMGCRSFSILGFDLLLTSQRKAYLIEVNHLPSLNTDSPLDYDIKRRLIDQALDITCSHLSATDCESYAKKARLGQASCHLLEEPHYKDFVRAFPPTEDCPSELAAQYASVRSRVREVFKPIITKHRGSRTNYCPKSSYYCMTSFNKMPSPRSAWAEVRDPPHPVKRMTTFPSQRSLREPIPTMGTGQGKLRARTPPPSAQRNPSEANLITGTEQSKLRARTPPAGDQRNSYEPHPTTGSGHIKPCARTPPPRSSRGERMKRSSTQRKFSAPASGYSAIHAAKVAHSSQCTSWVTSIPL